MRVDSATRWEAPIQAKRQKATCCICSAAIDEGALRLRPAGTTRTRLLHPACASGIGVTAERVVNYAELAPAQANLLQQHLEHAARQGPVPGDAPVEAWAEESPSGGSLRSLEQFDLVDWDSALECYPCIRFIPDHWAQIIWNARMTAARAIVEAHEQAAQLNLQRLWKAFTMFDALILGRPPRLRGGRRGQGSASLNETLRRAFGHSGPDHGCSFSATLKSPGRPSAGKQQPGRRRR